MNQQHVGFLNDEHSAILRDLGLPKENLLLGRNFKFVYYRGENQVLENLVRITGTILGTHMTGNSAGLTLLTTPLPKSFHTDSDPYISLMAFEVNSPYEWRIFFPSEELDPYKSFEGELYLL